MDGPGNLIEHFSGIKDPRIDRTKLHKLIDIIVLAICAILCGAEDWEEIELICNEKIDWFKKFLELPNGIPSHDTFARVFARISPIEFEDCFVSWISSVIQLTAGQLIAIDGKKLRRSYDRQSDKAAIHMVSAWAVENNLVLGQVKVDDKSNEITAIPQLLDILDIKGCIISIDAMGCQKSIAQKILDKEADYIFGLKGNQESTQEAVKEFFDLTNEKALSGKYETVEKGHGRIETREYSVADASHLLEKQDEWPGLKSIIAVKAVIEHLLDKKISEETRYFLSSIAPDNKQVVEAVRGHWGIETGLHWTLDVQMSEDLSRIRKDNAAENFSRLRRIALNLLKSEKNTKMSLRKKQMKCVMSYEYLAKVLNIKN